MKDEEPDEMREFNKVKAMFDATFPYKTDRSTLQFIVPLEGTYNIRNHIMKLSPGDVVEFDETGIPFLRQND